MKTKIVQGDLFESGADALVNPVNCVGVMGAGLAKEFKHRWPKYFEDYKWWCDNKSFVPGDLFIFLQQDGPGIISIATKNHWRNPSEYDWIGHGLWNLRTLLERGTSPWRSVAIPALGCGLGGLEWPKVRQMMENELNRENEFDCEVLIYEPR